MKKSIPVLLMSAIMLIGCDGLEIPDKEEGNNTENPELPGEESSDPDDGTDEDSRCIYYVSKDETIVEPFNPQAFNSQIESNVYTEGKGCIKFKKGLTSIGADAFKDCQTLTEISLPSKVNAIGDGAFAGCSAMEKITIPASVKSFGKQVFKGCTGEATVNCNIPEGTAEVEVISESPYTVKWHYYGAFSCADFTKVTISEDVTSIGAYAFSDCPSLISITLPTSVETIGDNAFIESSALKGIEIPSKVKRIGPDTFWNCYDLEEVTFNNGLESIGFAAFGHCNSLKTITLPRSLREIERHTFYGCISLESIVLPEGLTIMGKSIFDECSSLKEITIPSTVTRIEGDGFKKFTGKVTITGNIPDTITDQMDEYTFTHGMFQNAGFTEVVIDKGVTKIGVDAFQGCTNLKKITFPSTLTEIGAFSFRQCSMLETIDLPESLLKLAERPFMIVRRLLKSIAGRKLRPTMEDTSFTKTARADKSLFLSDAKIPTRQLATGATMHPPFLDITTTKRNS